MWELLTVPTAEARGSYTAHSWPSGSSSMNPGRSDGAIWSSLTYNFSTLLSHLLVEVYVYRNKRSESLGVLQPHLHYIHINQWAVAFGWRYLQSAHCNRWHCSYLIIEKCISCCWSLHCQTLSQRIPLYPPLSSWAYSISQAVGDPLRCSGCIRCSFTCRYL